MKTFQQFIESYADLRAKVRAKQMSHLASVKSASQAQVQRTTEVNAERKATESDQKRVQQIRQDTRNQVKREYGIKD